MGTLTQTPHPQVMLHWEVMLGFINKWYSNTAVGSGTMRNTPSATFSVAIGTNALENMQEVRKHRNRTGSNGIRSTCGR
jgi:hypothetical protein